MFHAVLICSVRYRASGAPQTAGPRPLSPPRPAGRPGVGHVFLPFRAPASGPTHSPAGPPFKIGGAKQGPVQGMSGDSPWTGKGAGRTLNITPPARSTVAPCEWKPAPPRPVTNSTHMIKHEACIALLKINISLYLYIEIIHISYTMVWFLST